MIKKIHIITVILFTSFLSSAQSTTQTENENYIFWQPGALIEFSSYKSQNMDDCHEYNEKYGVTMASVIVLRGVVDIPKKKDQFDRFYIAPAFCKNCSCLLSEDSLVLNVDRLLFDVAELCARKARMELLAIHKQMHSDNTYSIVFITYKNKWEKEMMKFFGGIITDIIINKTDSAYISWRKKVDDALMETNDYATKAEDCKRFITNEPEKGYKQAKSIVGDLKKEETL